MENKFVDTNIFIEVFARRGIKSENSKNLLKKGNGLMITSLVLSEIEWVLRGVYLLDRKVICKYIENILSSNIEVDNKKTLINVTEFYGRNSVDWTDCVNMFLMEDRGVHGVYSYDRGLNKFDWVKRLEP